MLGIATNDFTTPSQVKCQKLTFTHQQNASVDISHNDNIISQHITCININNGTAQLQDFNTYPHTQCHSNLSILHAAAIGFLVKLENLLSKKLHPYKIGSIELALFVFKP